MVSTLFAIAMSGLLAPGNAASTEAQVCIEWTLCTSGDPPARAAHALAYDSARGVTVLFGGYDGTYKSDTWEWNGTVWTLRAAAGPSARSGHAMAYDSARGVTVLFGGYDGLFHNDTWEWDGNTWQQRAFTGPPARRRHAMAYDSIRGVTVLFGGYGVISRRGDQGSDAYDSNYLDDTWEWDGTQWSRPTDDGPPGRCSHAAAFDSARGTTVVFGGEQYSGRVQETWEWNGASWALRVATGPSARSAHALAYDSARGFVVLFGGYDGEFADDVWGWNGAQWRQWPATGIAGRYRHAMVYDSARDVMVLFGGLDEQYRDETWELRWLGDPPFITEQPTGEIACQGGSVEFVVSAGGTAPLTYQWRKNGIDIPDAIDESLTIDAVDVTHAGTYDVVVTNICGSLASAEAKLTVSTGSPITRQPQSQTVLEGRAVTFRVEADGTALLSYQWRKNGDDIEGAVDKTLTLYPVTLEDAGDYDVVVTDVCGSVVSNLATLVVINNCNGNLIPDACDIDCGLPGGPCDIPGCGQSEDCNANGMPDECEDDSDADGVIDGCDLCANTPPGLIIDTTGCPVPYGPCCSQSDMCVDDTDAGDCALAGGFYLGDGLTCEGDPDGDGAFGCSDRCPVDPDKTTPGICGCGTPDEGDADGDAVLDCIDSCPGTPPGTNVNRCGCPKLGACCFTPADCVDGVEPGQCLSLGGLYQGDGSTCGEGCGFGDFDDSGRVDLRDLAALQCCFTGLRGGPLAPQCRSGDIDRCDDVDLLDFAAFLHGAFTGP